MWEHLLESGWRRAGGMIYEPVCPYCSECIPMRIRPADFKPNRTQRRTLNRNRDLTARLVPALIDDERADLYRRYVRTRHNGMMTGSRKEFRQFLGLNPVPCKEIEIRQWTPEAAQTDGIAFEDSPLKAVMVVDQCPNSWSAVYCYFDPEEEKRSLGSFAILNAIRMCGLPDTGPSSCDDPVLYLGYWVKGSSSMAYKVNYKPHEIRDRAGKWHQVQ